MCELRILRRSIVERSVRFHVCEYSAFNGARFSEQLDLRDERLNDGVGRNAKLAASEAFAIGIAGMCSDTHAALVCGGDGRAHHLWRARVGIACNVRGRHYLEKREISGVPVAVVFSEVSIEIDRACRGQVSWLSDEVSVPKISAMQTASEHERAPKGIWRVIAASTAGTMIEWYDFFIFGSLATILSTQFYPPGSATASFLKTLATFAVGFAVRPLGALFFGRIGDLVGRKFAFLTTLLVMGGSTAAIGILPGYSRIGLAAPVILVVLRMLQGLALGGEYGGAAVYVAEHVPDSKRGFYTSFIQTTASLGLFISLIVILVTSHLLGDKAFAQWGWRIPFLLSIVLVIVSFYIRMQLGESPLFARLKAAGNASRTPIRESFDTWPKWKLALQVLFGVTAGQAVTYYTSHFYALFFLQTVLKVPSAKAYAIVAVAVVIGTPAFVIFGRLSDRIGRKRLMMAGNLLSALSYFALYRAMTAFSAPLNAPVIVGIIVVMIAFAAMITGPIASFLVESYPARVRYTSMSLPYHFGNGWFGGFLPLIATALVARTGNIYAVLLYPTVIALLTFVVGSIVLPETQTTRIWDDEQLRTSD
jgi:MFS family permease